MIDFTDKLVSIVDSSVIGFLISAGKTYKVSLTKEKAVSLGIKDADIADYFDMNELHIVPISNNKFGVVEKSSMFLEEYKDEPISDLGGKKLYYGYYFEPYNIVTLDNDTAIKRMLAEEKGVEI